jgi:hypothetical protein
VTLGVAIVIVATAGAAGLIIASVRAPRHRHGGPIEARRREAGAILLLGWFVGPMLLAVAALAAFAVIEALR